MSFSSKQDKGGSMREVDEDDAEPEKAAAFAAG